MEVRLLHLPLIGPNGCCRECLEQYRQTERGTEQRSSALGFLYSADLLTAVAQGKSIALRRLARRFESSRWYDGCPASLGVYTERVQTPAGHVV